MATATVVYGYDSYSSAPGWTNPGRAVDGQNDLEAVIGRSGMGSTTKIRYDDNTASGVALGIITKVEYGVYGSHWWPMNQCGCQFVGGGIFAVILSSGQWRWTDCSEELAGEDISDWNWDNINTLDLDMWMWNDVEWENFMDIDYTQIRVTYEEYAGPVNVAGVSGVISANINLVNGVDWQTSVKKICGVD
jgi:hypothetical protein